MGSISLSCGGTVRRYSQQTRKQPSLGTRTATSVLDFRSPRTGREAVVWAARSVAFRYGVPTESIFASWLSQMHNFFPTPSPVRRKCLWPATLLTDSRMGESLPLHRVRNTISIIGNRGWNSSWGEALHCSGLAGAHTGSEEPVGVQGAGFLRATYWERSHNK